jgi:hypothetical protein
MSPIVVEQLSPQPFRQWCAWRLDPKGWDRRDAPAVADDSSSAKQLAFDLGMGDRKLHRWRNENRTLERLEVEDALHHADVGLWEVYPDLDEPRRLPSPPIEPAKLTDEQLVELHSVHSRGVPVKVLGELVWERAGYANWKSAEDSIRRGFRRLGLRTKGPWGPHYVPAHRRCVAAVRTGDQCRQAALHGSDRCFRHDPSTQLAAREAQQRSVEARQLNSGATA